MVEKLRWITLIIMWACVFLNVCCIVMNGRMNKRYQEAYDNCMRILISCETCEQCEYYNPEAANCSKSGMKMIGKYGSCCYMKIKEDQNDGENHD